VGVVVAVDLELCDTLCKGLFAERNRQTLVFALERSFCKVASKLNLEAVPWFASDDAARIEYVTAAGERVQLTQASSVPWVTSRALEYRVILSSAATSSGSTHVGLGATLVSF
jgi:hypothetical protein